jgi:hypothetical protein
MALQQLEETAVNLHVEPHTPRWIFRSEINVVAQINRRARGEKYLEPARNLLVRMLRNLVGGTVTVYPAEEVPDQRELTLVLTTVRMESEEILDQLYYGRAYPNALVIVDPQDMASVMDSRDALWMARRIKAAEELRYDLVSDQKAKQKVTDFLDGVSGQRRALEDWLRDQYGAWRAPIYDPERGDLTFTRVLVTLDRTAIYRAVEQRYDAAWFRRNVMQAVESRSTPPTVDDVRADFLRQRSFAKPVWQGRPSNKPIDQAIRSLVAQARLEVIRGGDERYVCGRDPGLLQRHWTVAVPPEAHKPRFHLEQAVRSAVQDQPQGTTVKQLRHRLQEEAAQFPDEVVDAGRVDAHLTDLLSRRELETPQTGVALEGPLPDDLVVRPPRPTEGEPTTTIDKGPETLRFGPAIAPQIRTDVVSQIDKTDRLSKVTVSYRATLRGDDLKDQGDLVGLGKRDPGDGELSISWSLRDAPVMDRDGLLGLLSHLPHPHICEVTVNLQREKD